MQVMLVTDGMSHGFSSRRANLIARQFQYLQHHVLACHHREQQCHQCSAHFIHQSTRTHTHTRLMALFPGLPGPAGTRKVKPLWILLEPETVSGSGISWNICKSAPRSRQITTPAPHHSVFYRPNALPAAQPTVSKH